MFDQRDELPKEPLILTIFGATGDLTQRKLRPALYHLRADPGERKDLAAVEPGRLAELRARLEAFLRDAVPDLRTGLDTESAEGETAGKERRGPAPPRVPAAASDQAASSASVRIRK